MKWLFLGLMSLVSNLVSFLLNIITKMFMNGMELNSKIFSGSGEDTTLDLFFHTFPALEVFYNTLIGIAMAFVFIIYIFNLYKVFFYPPTESEDPIHLTGRAFISCVGIALSKLLCKILIGISSIAYADFANVDKAYKQAQAAAESQKVMSFSSILGADSTKALGGEASPLIQNVAIFAFRDVILFIVILLMIIMVIEYIKFLFEVVSRYVMFGIMCIFSPLAFACGASKSTSGILQGWWKAITSQTFLICLSVFFMKVFTSSLAHAFSDKDIGGGTVLQSMLMLIVWLMIAQKMDTHLRDLGAGALRSGDELAMNMIQYASAGAGSKAAIGSNMLGKAFGMTGLNMLGGKALAGAIKPGGGAGIGVGTNGGPMAPNLAGGIMNPRNQARPIAGTFARHSRQNAMGRALFGQKSMDPLISMMGQQGLNSDAKLSANTINSMVNGDFGSNIESAAHESIGKGTQAMFQDSQTAGVIGAGNTLGKAVVNPNQHFINSAIMDKDGNQIGTAKFSKLPIDGVDQTVIQDKTGQRWYASSDMSQSEINSYGTPSKDVPTGVMGAFNTVSTGIGTVSATVREHGALGAVSYGASKAYEGGANYVSGIKTSISDAGGVGNYVKSSISSQPISSFNTPLHSHIEGGTGISSASSTGSVGTGVSSSSGIDMSNIQQDGMSGIRTSVNHDEHDMQMPNSGEVISSDLGSVGSGSMAYNFQEGDVDSISQQSNYPPTPQPLDHETASFVYIDGEFYNSGDPYVDYLQSKDTGSMSYGGNDSFDDYPEPDYYEPNYTTYNEPSFPQYQEPNINYGELYKDNINQFNNSVNLNENVSGFNEFNSSVSSGNISDESGYSDFSQSNIENISESTITKDE